MKSSYGIWLIATTMLVISCRSQSAPHSARGTNNLTNRTAVAKPPAKVRWGEAVFRQKPEWYAGAAARTLADNILQYQSVAGGWPKGTDFTIQPTAEMLALVVTSGRANTIDNGGTTTPLRYLALMVPATSDAKYRGAFDRGLDYLFAAQYPNGGWPQFYPLRVAGYYSHITYNDNAMINVMNLLRDASAGKPPYDFVDHERRTKAAVAVTRGIECILRTQIKQGGKLTGWCAQHDEETLAPAWARNFEPPTLSGAESVGIVQFLMGVEQPTPEIIGAIEGAVAWFEAVAIRGLRYERFVMADGKWDSRVTVDSTAGPIWARFYELGTNRPIFVGRDKVTHSALNEIERERRGGYSYYTDQPAALLNRDYPRWRARN